MHDRMQPGLDKNDATDKLVDVNVMIQRQDEAKTEIS